MRLSFFSIILCFTLGYTDWLRLNDHHIISASPEYLSSDFMSLSNKSDSARFDPCLYHEQNAGRLIIDPECVLRYTNRFKLMLMHSNSEARRELGEKIASRLKLTKDGTKILWPQPTDSPLDPQNWSEWQKMVHLLILILVSIVPDFDSGLGIYRSRPMFSVFQNFFSFQVSLHCFPWRGRSTRMLM